MIGNDNEEAEVHYFTHIIEPRGSTKRETIKAWSWDKDLAKAYSNFHRSSNLKFKHYIGTIGEIAELLERYDKCEITIGTMKTRDPENPNKPIYVYVPATTNELNVIKDHVSSACSDMVHRYNELQDMFYKLKDKYHDALKLLLFEEFMNCSQMQPSIVPLKISFDEVRLLYYDNPDDFGN